MGADQLTSLANSGFDPSRVFRVGVKKMNRLRNLELRVNEGILEPKNYPEFMEVLPLIDTLSQEGLIDLAYGVKSSMGGTKFPLQQLDTTAIPDGLAYGLRFMTRDDPITVDPLKLFKPLFLRFSKESNNDPRAKRLRELLHLDPAKYSFAIVDTANSGTEQMRSESGKISQVFDPDACLTEIIVNNRSMIEVLYFASTAVELPRSDVALARKRDRSDRVESDWLQVRTSSEEPARAWIKIKFRGSWFYIAADDLKSRASFGLVDAMFASIVGNVPGAKPVLTLPVR